MHSLRAYFNYIKLFCFFQRVLQHKEESALLRAYIAEWGKFFTQCDYLPKPFTQLEANLMGKLHSSMPKKSQAPDESLVRKVIFLKDIKKNCMFSIVISIFKKKQL